MLIALSCGAGLLRAEAERRVKSHIPRRDLGTGGNRPTLTGVQKYKGARFEAHYGTF